MNKKYSVVSTNAFFWAVVYLFWLLLCPYRLFIHLSQIDVRVEMGENEIGWHFVYFRSVLIIHSVQFNQASTGVFKFLATWNYVSQWNCNGPLNRSLLNRLNLILHEKKTQMNALIWILKLSPLRLHFQWVKLYIVIFCCKIMSKIRSFADQQLE